MAWTLAFGGGLRAVLTPGNEVVIRRYPKKKGPPGMAVQPKSREETPKVGTPWRTWSSRGAACDMGMFVLRCNLGPEPAAYIGNDVAQEQHRPRPYGNARASGERGDPAAPNA